MTNIGGTGIAISAKTKYPEQAWRFAKFWGGLEGQMQIAAAGLWMPPLKSVGLSPAFKNAHPKMAHATLFTDVLAKGYVHSLPISRAWNDFSPDYGNVLLTDIYQNNKPAAQALPKLDTVINASIKKFG
jgi:multiple sugar transport system substrate-binding protein